ncbi:MAG: hypothetical protein ACE5JB_12540 [bacterium]
MIKEDARKKGGKYRVRMESAMYGKINGKGPEYYFSTYTVPFFADCIRQIGWLFWFFIGEFD